MCRQEPSVKRLQKLRYVFVSIKSGLETRSSIIVSDVSKFPISARDVMVGCAVRSSAPYRLIGEVSRSVLALLFAFCFSWLIRKPAETYKMIHLHFPIVYQNSRLQTVIILTKYSCSGLQIRLQKPNQNGCSSNSLIPKTKDKYKSYIMMYIGCSHKKVFRVCFIHLPKCLCIPLNKTKNTNSVDCKI